MSEEEIIEEAVEEAVEETAPEVVDPVAVLAAEVAAIKAQIQSIVEIGATQEALVKNLSEQLIALQGATEAAAAEPEQAPEEIAEAVMLEKAGL